MGAIHVHEFMTLDGVIDAPTFEPAWSTRTVEDDPGAPFFNDTTKYVVASESYENGVVYLDYRP